MRGPTAIGKGPVIFVEGGDERLVLARLLSLIGRNDIQTIDYEGKDQLKTIFPTYAAQDEFRRLSSYAIVADADDSFQSRLDSIRHVLTSNGQPVPLVAGQFHDGKPRVGIFIFPNNNAPGSLETLFLSTIDDPVLLAEVDRYIEGLKVALPKKHDNVSKQDATFYAPRNVAKVKVLAAFCATLEPVRTLGAAAERGYWNWQAPTLSPFKHFIGQL